jgi:prophage regulatory protein
MAEGSTIINLIDYSGLRAKGITFSKTHLWRLVKAAKFPKPVKLGEGRNAWVESEIDRYIAQKVADRDAVSA